MKLASDGKIDADGVISSSEMITEKEGYEAMLYSIPPSNDTSNAPWNKFCSLLQG